MLHNVLFQTNTLVHHSNVCIDRGCITREDPGKSGIEPLFAMILADGRVNHIGGKLIVLGAEVWPTK
jgi:hypothetical protein